MARKTVTIVGGGVAGLATAWQLASAGCDVAILDAARPGSATRSSAGMLCARLEMTHAAPPLARFALNGLKAWPGLDRALREETGLDTGFRANGALDIVLETEGQAHPGPGVEIIDGDAARSIEPGLSSSISSAVWAHGEAHADPRRLVDALLAAARARGVSIEGQQAVHRLVTRHGRVCGVETAERRIEADHVVLAAGAWTTAILKASGLPAPRIRPVKGQMLSLTADPDAMPLSRPLWLGSTYIVPQADGRIIVGATQEEAGYDTSIDHPRLDALRAQAQAVLPALAHLPESERFCGFRPASDDALPVLGGIGIDGLTLASGQFRNGILFAPVMAEAASAHVLTGALPAHAEPFAAARFVTQAVRAQMSGAR